MLNAPSLFSTWAGKYRIVKLTACSERRLDEDTVQAVNAKARHGFSQSRSCCTQAKCFSCNLGAAVQQEGAGNVGGFNKKWVSLYVPNQIRLFMLTVQEKINLYTHQTILSYTFHDWQAKNDDLGVQNEPLLFKFSITGNPFVAVSRLVFEDFWKTKAERIWQESCSVQKTQTHQHRKKLWQNMCEDRT